MSIFSIPIDVNCVHCDGMLFKAVVTIQLGEEPKVPEDEQDFVVVDTIDVICPQCKSHVTNAIDDVSRAFKDVDDWSF